MPPIYGNCLAILLIFSKIWYLGYSLYVALYLFFVIKKLNDAMIAYQRRDSISMLLQSDRIKLLLIYY